MVESVQPNKFNNFKTKYLDFNAKFQNPVQLMCI